MAHSLRDWIKREQAEHATGLKPLLDRLAGGAEYRHRDGGTFRLVRVCDWTYGVLFGVLGSTETYVFVRDLDLGE